MHHKLRETTSKLPKCYLPPNILPGSPAQGPRRLSPQSQSHRCHTCSPGHSHASLPRGRESTQGLQEAFPTPTPRPATRPQCLTSGRHSLTQKPPVCASHPCVHVGFLCLPFPLSTGGSSRAEGARSLQVTGLPASVLGSVGCGQGGGLGLEPLPPP